MRELAELFPAFRPRNPLPGCFVGLALSLVLACGGGAKPRTTPYPIDTSTLDAGQQIENPPGWYRDAVIYQVWVRAFADGVYNDGIGDLPGLESKLDYLQNLGVNTLWLSPIFECAYKGDNMHGYDTTDYYAINDRFGQKKDLKALIDDVHGRGMRILFDFVPNHTSTQHAWFTDRAAHPGWYVWAGSPLAGWGYPWGGGSPSDVWRYSGGSYFYSAFGVDSMADLNYENASARAAIQDVERYWLDRGFDGMRVDAARYLCETGPGQQADQPETHARLKEFRALLDEFATGDTHPHPGNDPARHSVKAMIAEAWTDDATSVGPYYGNGSDEFNLCLDFSAPWAIYNALHTPDATRLTSLWEYEQIHYPAGYQSAVFDSNHDNLISRPGTQYGGDRRLVVLAETLSLLAPGTPILYYGNEVGMTGQSGTDLNLRQPMDWGAVQTQSGSPDSILSWCRYLIQARNAYPALRGTYATLATDLGPAKALAYVRGAGTDRVIVVANLTGNTETVVLQNLSAQGIASGTSSRAILGNPQYDGTVNGSQYAVASLPAHACRVLYLGSAFKGNLHGDIQ